LGLGVIVCLIARHLLKARWRHDYSSEDWALRRERWPTRKERERMREEMAEAGSVSAWIRASASKTAQAEQRTRMLAMNALAKRLGHAIPYPELEEGR
jgi:hypothetical protein